MEISKAERLILYMLCDVYKALSIKGDVDPDFIKSALNDGQFWAIPATYHGLINDEVHQNSDIARDVGEILTLWSLLISSFQRLAPADQLSLNGLLGVENNKMTFPGFDGNYETDHMATARFYIDEMDRFAEFKGVYLNSHRPILDKYHHMVAVHRSIYKKKSSSIDLDVNDIKEILSA